VLRAPLLLVLGVAVVSACGTPKPPDAPDHAGVMDKHAAAESAPHVDPNEQEGPIRLTALVPKGAAKSSFPKPTIGDHACLGQVAITGHHKQDYAAIVEKCGAPTGMVPFTEPAEGRLHAKLDKRDHFQMSVYKDMCYRYFAVADDGIKDIDILVLKKGALLATDRTEQHIAVIESDKLWCVDDDMDLDFAVEVDGPGAGEYTFAAWTRPK
jgi:hypothetical protein